MLIKKSSFPVSAPSKREGYPFQKPVARAKEIRSRIINQWSLEVAAACIKVRNANYLLMIEEEESDKQKERQREITTAGNFHFGGLPLKQTF